MSRSAANFFTSSRIFGWRKTFHRLSSAAIAKTEKVSHPTHPQSKDGDSCVGQKDHKDPVSNEIEGFHDGLLARVYVKCTCFFVFWGAV